MPSLKNSLIKVLISLLVLSLAVSTLKKISPIIRRSAIDSSGPVLTFFDSVRSTLKKIIPFASLREENKKLRSRVELLSRRLDEAKMIYEENERLLQLLDFKKSVPYSLTPARVIGRDPSNWSNSLIIDKGSRDGIKENTAVLSTKGLVGRVVLVGRASSKISLITDPSSKTGVIIKRNRQGGVLVGRPDGSCRMIYIALDSDVAKADKVITAGFSAVFPKNILVGEVVRVEKEPGRLYKNAVVKPAQDLARLEEVLCVR